MANQHTAKKTAPAAAPQVEYVTKEEFTKVLSTLDMIAELLEKQMLAGSQASPEAVKKEKEIAAAAPDAYSVDTEWDDIAREIIGEAVDHTEVVRKGGGIKFTVVIKTEFSNAPKEYMDRTKVDRRTREVGAEGTEGVSQYCKLVKANLNKNK